MASFYKHRGTEGQWSNLKLLQHHEVCEGMLSYCLEYPPVTCPESRMAEGALCGRKVSGSRLENTANSTNGKGREEGRLGEKPETIILGTLLDREGGLEDRMQEEISSRKGDGALVGPVGKSPGLLV